MDRLVQYFTQGLGRGPMTIGAEVETQFVTAENVPITAGQSQLIFKGLVALGWQVASTKGSLLTSILDISGNRFSYELGRHNIELSAAPMERQAVISNCRICLSQLYQVAERMGAFPFFQPVLEGDEDLLMIPDERDATWLMLDGRSALAPLARTSSVQFTVSVALEDAVQVLNKLGEQSKLFLADYPQTSYWYKYIRTSLAGYRQDRYGGPLRFTDIRDYCRQLSMHDVVKGGSLVPLAEVAALDIPLYLRSIWWHFRLKRYGDTLCIEVRPQPRKEDALLPSQLAMVLGFF